MDFQTAFKKLKPVLDSYIEQEITLHKQIAREGTLSDEIKSECPIHNIVKVEKFNDDAIKSTSNLVKWIQENKISWIESDQENIYLKSRVKKIEGRKGKETVDSMLISHDSGLKSKEKEYEFKFSLNNLKKKDFFQILRFHPFSAFSFCEHSDTEKINHMRPVIIEAKEERHFFSERGKSISDILDQTEPEPILELMCADCYGRINKICCQNAIVKRGVGYESDYHHNFDHLLFKLILKKNNVSFKEFNEENQRMPRRSSFYFYLPEFNSLVVQNDRDLDQIIDKLKPSILISKGNVKDIVSYLSYNTNLIIYDDSEDINQRYFIFDKNKPVEENIEKCCNHIIKNLETYVDELRGKEHDRIIESLAKIGKELGFISQRELSIKGIRIDLVWLNRNNSVFGAIEVETSSQWKKDIVSTWETEPQIAIIVSHSKTEKVIGDILQYILLKAMPHKLLFINNTTKKAFLIENQSLIHVYDLMKQKEIPKSEIYEY